MKAEITLEERFIADIKSNEKNRAIIGRLADIEAPDVWLVAGCLFQTVWNLKYGNPPTHAVRDYDLSYYDPDISYEAEDAVIRQVDELFADLDVKMQIRNQARVPLWYKEKFGGEYLPVSGTRESIERYLVECTCVGVRKINSSDLEVYAPYGLEDLYAGILRPNRHHYSDPKFVPIKVASYQERWPELTFSPL